MDITFDFTFNAIAIITSILAWGVIFLFAYRIYKKQTVRPKIWKIFIVIYVGIFSFSLNWNMFNTMLKVSILPLGVWILYFIFRGKDERWQSYRSFAWLGFLANFIFLASTLITIPAHHAIYPKDEPSTYLANFDHASIINIHPSAKERSLHKENILKQLYSMRQEMIHRDQGYEDMYLNNETNKRNERFPYQLIGTSSKWGSGLQTMIYIEEDGKGIIISTSTNQLYYRFEDSLFEGVE